ncbi:hypothetical protein V501_00783 [Pseudogymnoascus sp. VKM F-4519 (FW-2642)]|nr:hypothetical protein V501_00783 [Pseudogymnoascus sp. VKM F-4519 (FW-2642)]
MAPKTDPPPPIAIVGIGLRLPGGISTTEEFWDMLITKRNGRSRVPGHRFNVDSFYGYKQGIATDYGYFLQDLNLKAFDSSFFSMSRAEVEILDPQQRLLLEVVWECMESAGQTKWRGTNIGCYVGVFGEDWHDLGAMDTQDTSKYRINGSDDFAIPSRISYEYDLKGPCVAIRTACSSSLYALHEACQAIYDGECSAALVCGSNLLLSPTKTLSMTKIGFLSPTGSCKTFDAAADGYTRGEAINAVFIKPLEDAIRDNDPIRAVIRATAVNHDGKTPTFAMPNGESHEAMIRRAYEVANLPVSETTFIECHGTGTRVGDRIETTAVANIFGERGAYIGAVKPNVGHSEGASGLTSLIKAALALENEVIPPNINFSHPNPELPLERGKLEVPLEATPWPEGRHPRVSVSSFGAGGSNAHVILDSAASFGISRLDEDVATAAKVNSNRHSNGHGQSNGETKEWPRLLCVSANNAHSLQLRVQSLQNYLQSRPDSLDRVAYTLGSRREHLRHRTFCLVGGGENAPEFESFQEAMTSVPEIVFVFTGQGAQWPGMGKSLVNSSSSFCRDIQELDNAMQGLPEPPQWKIEHLLCTDDANWVDKAEFSQPLSAAVQIALVNLLRECGITANAIVGHSSGEIAGAYAAGALTAAEAISCAYYRGLITKYQTRKGGMAAVGLGRDAVAPYLSKHVMIACENSPKSVTLSGDLDALEKALNAVKISDPATFTRLLPVDMAYHSDHMISLGEKYENLLQQYLSGRKATTPVYSSVTGQCSTENTLFGPAYWRRSLESPVLFNTAVQALLNDYRSEMVFLEIGPHSALKGPLRQIFQGHRGKPPVYLPTLTKNNDSTVSVLTAVGKLYTHGYIADLSFINPQAPVLTDLPLYPWDHKTEIWSESRISLAWRERKHPHHELLGSVCLEASDIEPSWRNLMRLNDVPWLKDHKITHHIIFPAAGYIAMMGEAIRQVTKSEAYMLRNLVIKAPLILPESDSVEIITTIKPMRLTDSENSAWYEISISSFNKTSWIQHCVAQGKSGQEYSPVEKTAGVFPRKISRDFWYERLQHLGLNYGPCFRGLSEISADPKETVAVATVRNDRSAQGAKYSIHPTTLDFCLQLLTVAITNGVAYRWTTPAIPTSIGHIYVKPGDGDLTANAATHADVKGGTTGQFTTVTADNKVIIELENATFSPWETRKQASTMDALSAARLEWRPDVDLLPPGSLMSQGTNKSVSMQQVDRVCALGILKTLDIVERLDVSSKYLLKYASGLRQERVNMAEGGWASSAPEAQQWVMLDTESRNSLLTSSLDEVEEGADEDLLAICQLLRRICDSKNIQDIFLGKANVVQLLTEADGLSSIYNRYRDMMDFSEFISLCGHSRPMMKVLEVGAGTGATTEDILRSLTSNEGVRIYSQYTFTDISAGFFKAAEEKFRDFSAIQYKVLDISRDPAEQGFELGTYDLVVAANVLHATPSIAETLRNVRLLLRPGGRLFLQETVIPSQWRFPSFVMGYLPGWWLGEDDGRPNDPRLSVERWDQELRDAGFSGSDSAALDDEAPRHINAHIVSTAVGTTTSARGVTILYGAEKHPFARDLALRLEEAGIGVVWVKLGDHKNIPEQDIISTVELDGPYFHDISAEGYESFKDFLSKLKVGVLWCTRPAQLECTDPRYGATLGLARTIRLELLLDFTTIELQNLDASALDATLAVFKKFQGRSSSGDYAFEPEFAVHDGTVYTGRFHWVSASEELESRVTEKDPKRLTIGQYGSIDSLRWIQHEAPTTLEPDEVEIDIRCVGLNFRDVLVTMGVVAGRKDELGFEASAVIAQVGSAITHLKVGDRVVTIASDCFATRKVVLGALVVRIPEYLSFEDAATVPVIYTTVIQALINVGQLKRGQSVLIHSACGGIGLAALQICQMLGVEIYVTVGNEEKVQYLMNNYNLVRERIFNSRDDSFLRGIMRATNDCGVDLVLNSLSGELLHASWKCVAKYGRMIEIGKRDLLGRGQLSLDPFEDNRTFCGVDIAGLVRDRPQVIHILLNQVVQYLDSGCIKPIPLSKTFSAQQTADAFRYMQKGKHIGKIVINLSEEDHPITAVVARKRTALSDEATYLLVGGLGGLGKAVATWMIERGARNFVFLSRSAGKSIEDQLFFRELEAQDCTAVAIAGSVVELDDVKRAVQAAPTPIAGVLQMSMVLRDEAILNMSYDEWIGAQNPKVKGTWNLHEALSGYDLAFFILFSSLSGTTGIPGQANYASANTFLNSFAQYRQGNNLPCSVIDLGVFEGAGYVSNNSELMRSLRDGGFYMMQPEDLMDAIEISISRSLPPKASSEDKRRHCSLGQLSIGMRSAKLLSDPGNVCTWKRDVRMSLYRYLESSEEKTTDTKDGRLQALLNSVSVNPKVFQDQTSLELVTSAIGHTLCSYVLQPQEDLDVTTSLSSLGIDSLVSIEFRNWFRRTLSVDISSLEIVSAGTIEHLGKMAIALLLKKYGVNQPGAQPYNLEEPVRLDLDAEFLSYTSASWNLEGLLARPLATIPPKANIFLTGATGYLGTEILNQLLQEDVVGTVIVLVRAQSVEHGIGRIKETAQIAGWWCPSNEARIEIWPGDLLKPGFGLEDDQMSRLRGESSSDANVNAIIHNGAVVNWIADYERLRTPNIESALQLLRITEASPASPKFIYISGGVKKSIKELLVVSADELFSNSGYSQTKIMTESILREIASRLPAGQNRISVIKPGLVISPTGIANVDDVLWRAAATVAGLKAIPTESEDKWLPVTGSDTVAQIVTKQLFATVEGETFIDMLDGMLISEFWDLVNQELELVCSPVPWDDWLELARAATDQGGQQHPMWAVQHLFNHRAPLDARPAQVEDSPQLHLAVRASMRYLLRIGFIHSSAGKIVKAEGQVLKRSTLV